jgi:hypothetical protein
MDVVQVLCFIHLGDLRKLLPEIALFFKESAGRSPWYPGREDVVRTGPPALEAATTLYSLGR